MRSKGCTGAKPLLFFSYTYEFLECYLLLQVGRSPYTVESYRDALTIFRRFVRDERGLALHEMTFDDCTKDLVLSFMENLCECGYAAGTCNQRLAALKSYLWFASDKNVAVQSVALAVSHIPPVKGSSKHQEKLTEEALRAIMNQPDPKRSKKGVRDLTILILFYDSGIRLSELLGLNIGNLFLDNEPHIYVMGKGNKERVVAVTQKTSDHLRAYILLFHGESPKPEAPLFFTVIKNVRNRMSPSNVERLVQRYADLARISCSEIPDKVYPHMFRRSRATDLYQNGVPLELVSRILGHSSTNTTKVYAKPSLDMLHEAMEAVNPLPDNENPAWLGNEDEMVRLCGLR